MRIKSVQAWWVQHPDRRPPASTAAISAADAPLTRPSCASRPRTAWSAGAKARTPPAAPGNYGALVHLLNHEVGAAADRARRGRHHRDLGDALQRRARRLGRARGPCHAALARRGLTRRRDQRRRHRAVGHSRQVARTSRSGSLLGGRKADRLPAYASGGWAAGRQDRRAVASPISTRAASSAVKMRVGAMDGAPHVSAARVKAARAGAWARYRDRCRRAWHLHGRARPSASPIWSRTATSPGSRSRSSPTTSPAWPRCAQPTACRSPPAKARRRASTSATWR